MRSGTKYSGDNLRPQVTGIHALAYVWCYILLPDELNVDKTHDMTKAHCIVASSIEPYLGSYDRSRLPAVPMSREAGPGSTAVISTGQHKST
jgi:hypothetical protein